MHWFCNIWIINTLNSWSKIWKFLSQVLPWICFWQNWNKRSVEYESLHDIKLHLRQSHSHVPQHEELFRTMQYYNSNNNNKTIWKPDLIKYKSKSIHLLYNNNNNSKNTHITVHTYIHTYIQWNYELKRMMLWILINLLLHVLSIKIKNKEFNWNQTHVYDFQQINTRNNLFYRQNHQNEWLV